MNKEILKQCEARVAALMEEVKRHRYFSGYGVNFPMPVIKEMKSYRSLGRAGIDKKTGLWTIWVNPHAIEAVGFDHYAKTTLPHEVAHIACMFTEIDFGHGLKWKSVARHLGDTGDRCADKDESQAFRATLEAAGVVRRPKYRYIYVRMDGTTARYTAQRHNKIQKNPSLLKTLRLNPWGGERIAV